MRDDEQFWYQHPSGWKVVARNLRRAAEDKFEILRSYCSLSSDDTEGNRSIADRYVAAVMKMIDVYAARDPAERDIDDDADGNAIGLEAVKMSAGDMAEREWMRRPWVWALRLFDQPGLLAKALAESQPAICGHKDDVKPEAALMKTVLNWAFHARARLLKPDEPNRLRVWNEILESDRWVTKSYGPPEHPLERDHLLRVHHENRLKVEAGNKNVPRTIKTLTEYYLEFDQRCRVISMTMDDGSDLDRPDASPEQIRDLMRYAGFSIELRDELMKMPTKVRPAFEHWMSLELRDITGKQRSGEITAFRRKHGLKKVEYDQRVESGKARLYKAFKDTFSVKGRQ
ncbi:hypothetical protein HL658_35595 [Azospirillum sp. RWY-5-1]|uniref:Uncharacterized protein n=1 Tax=Azospirillum oleiclasticum TaxID=2735135 RepID=A0ABX2TLS1_9PROT|nr:hypothetical protein [Azospirillum oleiclasticum]NYZ17896.1 hypothetical protein [Azospirillum oleiclasticum]NYZ25104.1 hypothetical protein [Azospirillum oleiclasticum]